VDIRAQIARWPALAEGHGERVVRAHRPSRGHALRLSRGPSDGLREADGTLRNITMENKRKLAVKCHLQGARLSGIIIYDSTSGRDVRDVSSGGWGLS
jgi:hypothetical protein